MLIGWKLLTLIYERGERAMQELTRQRFIILQ